MTFILIIYLKKQEGREFKNSFILYFRESIMYFSKNLYNLEYFEIKIEIVLVKIIAYILLFLFENLFYHLKISSLILFRLLYY
jgi:hypothetical protein